MRYSVSCCALSLLVCASVVSALYPEVEHGIPERDEYYARLEVPITATGMELKEAFMKLFTPHHEHMLGDYERTPEEHDAIIQAHLSEGTRVPADIGGYGGPRRIPREPTEGLYRLTRAYAVLHEHHLRAAYDAGGHDAVQAALQAQHDGPLTTVLPPKELYAHPDEGL
jgi:hypothetical protein